MHIINYLHTFLLLYIYVGIIKMRICFYFSQGSFYLLEEKDLLPGNLCMLLL